MKKIAFALEKFSRHAGGAESYAVSLATALIEHGWDVHLIGESWDGEPQGAHFHKMHIPKGLPAWIKLLLFAFRHRTIATRGNYDVVVGFGNTIYMNVYQSHGGVHRYSTARMVYAETNIIKRFLKRVLILLSIKQWTRAWIESAPFRIHPGPKIIAISRMVQKDMEAYFHVNAAEIETIYNGVDTERFNTSVPPATREQIRGQWGVCNQDIAFLFVAYDLKKKGIEPLIRAAAKLKAAGNKLFKVIVVGGSPNRSLVKRVKRLDLENHVVFTGKVQSMSDVYASCDAFVLPTYSDACSLVVIEAMASGLAAITTTANGASGIITDGKDGYIIAHPPDSSALAEKMTLLMENEKRGAMSKEAFITGQKYSAKRNHRDIMKVFDEMAIR